MSNPNTPPSGSNPTILPPGRSTDVPAELATTLADQPWEDTSDRPSDQATVLVDEPGVAETWAGDGARRKVTVPDPARTGFGTTVLPEVDRSAPKPVLRARSEARFVVQGRLGEGGLGEVVSALDQDIGRKVAIKRIRRDRVSDGVIVRFLQEIQTIGRLEHPNIIPIHDVGRDVNGALYFVMRHVDGETLEAIITRLRAGHAETHRQFGFERRVQIIAAVLDALAFAHARGVIHRDIKPANVMIGRYGEVMLLDWGIARLVDADPDADTEEPTAPRVHAASSTRIGAIVGTPAYMSPEQARGQPADARSDLYATCVMLHEFLTLEHYLADCPSAEAMLAAIPTRAVPFASWSRSPHQDRVPMDLTWYIDAGVQKDPTKRYPSADAMLDRLARRAEGDIPIQCHVTFTKRATTLLFRYVNQYAMVAAVAMVVIGLGSIAALVAGVVSVVGVVLSARG